MAVLLPLISPRIDWAALLLLTALLSTLATLGRQLPLQNVMLISLVFGIASIFVTVLAARSADWRLVALWTTVLINSWGSAQFIMRRANGARFYGWGVLLVAVLIASVFGGILYSGWAAAGFCAFTSAVILLIGLPLLINKRPVKPPVSWQPIAVLVALGAWLVLR